MDEKTSEAAKGPIHLILGVTVQNLTPQVARKLGLKKSAGVVVTWVESGSPTGRKR